MAKQDKKSIFSDWLETLQQESWQLELLISGLALFGIYESQDLLWELRMYVNANSEGTAAEVQSFFITILRVGWKIFFINLLIHVILRGLWIGAIGLRYVSEDIDYESLNYSQYFTKMLQKKVGGFDDFIEKLEKICSVLFAYTFLLFLLFFSFAFFFFQLLLIAKVGSAYAQVSETVVVFTIVFYLLIGFVVCIDFITLGLLKKIEEPTLNKIYGYIFTFYGWTTLTFLYRPLLYNFLDNRYTKRLFYFSIPYILLIIFSTNMFTNNNFTYFPGDPNDKSFGNTIDRMHYEDLRKEYLEEADIPVSTRRQNIPGIILNKYMNDEDYLKIFLKMEPKDHRLIRKYSDVDPYWKSGFNFSLFTSEEHKDKFYVEGQKQLSIELDSIRSVRRELRKQRRKSSDSLEIKKLDLQIDSITDFVDAKRSAFKDEGFKFEEEKQTRTINAFLNLYSLEINDKDAKPDMDCFFYRYHNNDEKGVLCLYPMDSLALGKQLLHYSKKTSTKNENAKDEMKIPFYKVRSFN